MAEIFVARSPDFAEGDRRIVTYDGVEIGVFRWQGSSTPMRTCAFTRAARPAKA